MTASASSKRTKIKIKQGLCTGYSFADVFRHAFFGKISRGEWVKTKLNKRLALRQGAD